MANRPMTFTAARVALEKLCPGAYVSLKYELTVHNKRHQGVCGETEQECSLYAEGYGWTTCHYETWEGALAEMKCIIERKKTNQVYVGPEGGADQGEE